MKCYTCIPLLLFTHNSISQKNIFAGIEDLAAKELANNIGIEGDVIVEKGII